MIWWRQLLKKTRYFIVTYTYQYEIVDVPVTGHGQLTSVISHGKYVSIDGCIEHIQQDLMGEITTFLVDNIIELNKKDYIFFMENNIKLSDEKSDNDNDSGND